MECRQAADYSRGDYQLLKTHDRRRGKSLTIIKRCGMQYASKK